MTDRKKQKVKRTIKNALSNRLVVGIAFLVFGLGMVFCPEPYIKAAVIVIGIIMLIVCAVRVFFFIRGEKDAFAILGLVLTIIFAVLGVICIAASEWVVSIIYFIFGILIIIDGIFGIYNSVAVLRRNDLLWMPFAILSLVSIAIGVVLLFNPFGAAEWTLRLVGASLALGGIFDICHFFAGRRAELQ